MVSAIEALKAHGALYRHRGGYWHWKQPEDVSFNPRTDKYVLPVTMNALEARGVVKFEWRHQRPGGRPPGRRRQPYAARLTEKGRME